jgi:hypothetical protein
LGSVFYALRWLVKTGAHWRMMANDLPPWPAVYQQTRRWIRYLRTSFWPGLKFDTLADLNRQALVWYGEADGCVLATTREVPRERLAREGLTPLNGHPAYDTSYASQRQVARDCLVSYRGNPIRCRTHMRARASR